MEKDCKVLRLTRKEIMELLETVVDYPMDVVMETSEYETIEICKVNEVKSVLGSYTGRRSRLPGEEDLEEMPITVDFSFTFEDNDFKMNMILRGDICEYGLLGIDYKPTRTHEQKLEKYLEKLDEIIARKDLTKSKKQEKTDVKEILQEEQDGLSL